MLQTVNARQNALAIGWILLGMTCYTLLGALMKHLARHHADFTILFFANLLTLVLVSPWALRRRAAAIRTRRYTLHGLRILFNALSTVGTLYAVQHLAIGELTVYQLTTPIWLIPLALLLLKEAVRPVRWAGMLLGFAGVWIVAAPDFAHGIQLAVIVALACALSDALLGVLLKQADSEPPLAILWWTHFGKTGVFGLLTGFALPVLTLQDGLRFLGMAFANIACMFCFITGYRAADATVAETGAFSGLLIGPLIGWLMFGEVMGVHFWVGAAVLLAGLLVVLFEPDPHRWIRRAADRAA
jgi:drug/metabolite transporter (DMT)-like permease